MNPKQSCKIRLLNKSYEMKCIESDIESLQQAALKLNACFLEKKSKLKPLDDYHALLLTALHLSHELITQELAEKQKRQRLAEMMQSLEHKISTASAELRQIDEPTPETA